MQRLRSVIRIKTTSQAERKVAEEELAQLEGAKAYIHHHTHPIQRSSRGNEALTGSEFLARRIPGDCPPFGANWDAANARFRCGPEAWVIPWQFVSHWRPLVSAPAWPQPRNGSSPWQDTYLCPPADGQSVWLRRCGEDSAAFRAAFDRSRVVFTLPSGWQIQWYEAWKWRL